MKTFPILILVLLLCIYCQAKTGSIYNTSEIPASLKEDAHAIIRKEKTEITVLDLDKVKYKKTYAITILDPKGDKYAGIVRSYNLLKKIVNISGHLYDSSGKELKELKQKDIRDKSLYGTSFVFHSDSRIKHFDFDYFRYPYTVEYTVEEIIKTTFFIPEWNAQRANDCAVEETEFVLSYPTSKPVKIKEYAMPDKFLKTDSTDGEGSTIITWKLKNIPAKYEQPYSKSENYDAPTVVLSANHFKLLDYEGNMLSWKELGLFNYNLNKGRDELPDDKRAIVKSMMEGQTGTYNKVQALYSYMQKSTRYVANEYGIAGWQTFDALNVSKNGYGDCKGLTNYLKALLKEAGIKSYTTLVFAGNDDYFKLDESFPANVFNHVILCVPDENDSIWVECTSQQLSAGYLGSFTQDRKVLMLTEDGGIVCQTPAYNQDKNYITRKAIINLDLSTSSQKVSLINYYAGMKQDNLNYILKTEHENKIMDMVNAKFTFPTYKVDNYKYNNIGSQTLPIIEELVEVSASGITSGTQKRTFVNLGWMSNPMNSIFQTNPRTAPIVLDESFKTVDSIIVNLPPGLDIESIPVPVNLEFSFGSYKTTIEKTPLQIILVRTFIQKKGIFKAEEYSNYTKMYSTINAGKNNINIVLLNKAS